MSAFDDAHAAFAADDAEFYGAYLATYTPEGGSPVANVRVMRREGVLQAGDFSQVQSVRTEIQISLTDVPLPVPGAAVVIGATTYYLESLIDRVGGDHTAWLVTE